MFYSTQILSRKGPLATIWIASHLNTRLKRAQVVDTSIAGSVGAYVPAGEGGVLYYGSLDLHRREHRPGKSHSSPCVCMIYLNRAFVQVLIVCSCRLGAEP